MAAASTSRRKPCGVWARNSVSRGNVATMRAPVAGATCLTVSCTGTAGTTAPLASAPSMARSITSAVTNGRRRVVDEDDRGVGGDRGEAFGDRVLPPGTAGDDPSRLDRIRQRRGVAPLREHQDDLADPRVRVEGRQRSLEQRRAPDRQPLLGHAAAQACALAARRDDHRDRHALRTIATGPSHARRRRPRPARRSARRRARDPRGRSPPGRTARTGRGWSRPTPRSAASPRSGCRTGRRHRRA